MVAERVAHVLLALINLGLFFMVIWLLARHRTDSFRDRLFILRDDLFDVALRGSVSFDDRAYTMLRGRINSMLQFAHHVRLSHVILLSIFSKEMMSKTAAKIENEWNDTLNELEIIESRKVLQSIHDGFHLTVGLHAVTGAMTLALLWVLLRFGNQMREQVNSYFRKKALVVEAECRFSRDDRVLSLSVNP